MICLQTPLCEWNAERLVSGDPSLLKTHIGGTVSKTWPHEVSVPHSHRVPHLGKVLSGVATDRIPLLLWWGELEGAGWRRASQPSLGRQVAGMAWDAASLRTGP